MNWQTLESEIQSLAGKITQANFQPDYIVAIVRGGMIPARLLSKLLKVKPIFCLNVDKDGSERKVTSTINYPLNGKKILLVEDMLESGKSLVVAQKWLEEKGAQVQTACLYTMPQTEHQPNFSLKEVSEVIPFPWE